MKIAISAGHNVYNNGIFDCGAYKEPYVESEITKETVTILIPILKSQGHDVIDVTPYNERFKTKKDHHILRCGRVDEFKADLYLDIHINAGGGTGVETWIHDINSKSKPYAEKICSNISKDIGIKNRGVKTKPNYWSVSLTSRPAMIIEGAFIDNSSDMKKLTPEKYAYAIAKSFNSIKKEGDKMDNKEQTVSFWAKEAWDWAKKNKITDGERPKDNMTREEMVTMLYRYDKLKK